MNYKPLRIKKCKVTGMMPALKAMRLPKGSKNDSKVLSGIDPFTTDSDQYLHLGENDKQLARSLVKAGPDHAKFTRGIIAYLEMEMQAGFMIEFETYRHGVECLSTSSSMHGELKGLKGEELAEQKQKDLSEKVYTRILTVSYQALRSMYKARRNHRHPDWQIFCDFVESLPYFDVFIYPEAKKEG